MTLALNINSIVWDTFGGLEQPKPEWKDQIGYWEDYAAKFFKSNGMEFLPKDSNVENWLLADDRAPFADMVQQLLPRLTDRFDVDGTDAILFAHWLPDIHLGTSVTNFAMHKLGLKDCLGFAISDRGLSAPFFAFDALYKYLSNGRKRGLLIIADQKHTMYKSDIIDRIDPLNSACVVPIDLTNADGPKYLGYARSFSAANHNEFETVKSLSDGFGLEFENTTFIGPDTLLADPRFADQRIITDDRLVCAAPFVALSDIADTSRNHVLLCKDGDCVTALGFHGGSK